MSSLSSGVPRVPLGFFPRPGRTPAALFARFAIEYYASSFPTVPGGGWQLNFLCSLENGTITPRALLDGWRQRGGSNVVGLIGPGASALTAAIAPMISPSVAWIEFSATATEFSDKKLYPTLSRVVPADNVSAALLAEILITHFGCTSINTSPFRMHMARPLWVRFKALSSNLGVTCRSRRRSLPKPTRWRPIFDSRHPSSPIRKFRDPRRVCRRCRDEQRDSNIALTR